jgi:hypothetical protein
MSTRRNSKSPARSSKGRTTASPSRSTSTNGGTRRRGTPTASRKVAGRGVQSEDDVAAVSTDDEIDVPSEERANDNAIDEYAHPSLSPLKLTTPTGSPKKVTDAQKKAPTSARKLFHTPAAPTASPGADRDN